jgi:hypothetical protein
MCLLMACGGVWGEVKTLPAFALGNANAAAGQVAAIPVSYVPSGETAGPSALVLRAAWDADWMEFTGVSAGPALARSGKTFDFEPHGKSVSVVVCGGRDTLHQGDLFYLNFQVSPSAAGGASAVLRDAGTNASDAAGEFVSLNVANGGVTVTAEPKPHTADYNKDWSISLSEVLRMVQLYNVGSLHCDAATEDGYAAGPGDQTCAPHDADYNPRDWKISLEELLRMIQFYNSPGGSYHVEPGTEDGFAPGPMAPGK